MKTVKALLLSSFLLPMGFSALAAEEPGCASVAVDAARPAAARPNSPRAPTIVTEPEERYFGFSTERVIAAAISAAVRAKRMGKTSAAVCNCAVCPERENDFVWENDKFGMRAYGPGEYHKWSGFDVFNKNTSSNVCLTWCHRLDRGNFHVNRGYGMDNYTMGASRGVGGIAMFADGEWKTYPDWEESRVLHAGDDYLRFELAYPAFSSAGRMTCRITLRRGERFFRNDVRFERQPPPGTFVGPGIDLEPKRDHKGNLREEPGLVSLFEDPKGKNGAEGSTMEAIFVADPSAVTNLTDRMNCRVLAFKDAREFTCWAGASWSLAGEITDAAAWHATVEAARDAAAR